MLGKLKSLKIFHKLALHYEEEIVCPVYYFFVFREITFPISDNILITFSKTHINSHAHRQGVHQNSMKTQLIIQMIKKRLEMWLRWMIPKGKDSNETMSKSLICDHNTPYDCPLLAWWNITDVFYKWRHVHMYPLETTYWYRFNKSSDEDDDECIYVWDSSGIIIPPCLQVHTQM